MDAIILFEEGVPENTIAQSSNRSRLKCSNGWPLWDALYVLALNFFKEISTHAVWLKKLCNFKADCSVKAVLFSGSKFILSIAEWQVSVQLWRFQCCREVCLFSLCLRKVIGVSSYPLLGNLIPTIKFEWKVASESTRVHGRLM